MSTTYETTLFQNEGETLADWTNRLWTALETAHNRIDDAERAFKGAHETLDAAMEAARAFGNAQAEVCIAETALEWAQTHQAAEKAFAATLDALVIALEEEALGGRALPHPGCPF